MNSAKKGLALVISNANYQIQPKLLSCKKDGLDMVNMLQYLNFDVLSATDTTREMLFNSLGEFWKLQIYILFFWSTTLGMVFK